MTYDANPRPAQSTSQKRGDLVVEEIKRWIAERRLWAGRTSCPRKTSCRPCLGSARATAREALKSLGSAGARHRVDWPGRRRHDRRGAARARLPDSCRTICSSAKMDVAQIYAVRRPARARAGRRRRAAPHERAFRGAGTQHRHLLAAAREQGGGRGPAPGGSALPPTCWPPPTSQTCCCASCAR